MHPLLEKLAGGDLRSIGRVPEVVAEVEGKPELFGALFGGLLAADPVIRMRSADAVEKITAQRPEALRPYKRKLLHEVAKSRQIEVRWHVAQLLPRLELKGRELESAVSTLLEYLEDESRIVKTFSMQALADLAVGHESLRSRVVPLLEELTRTGSPAMRSRGRKLLRRLEQMAGRT